MRYTVALIFCIGVFAIGSIPSFGADKKIDVKDVNEDELKKMAQYEKDRADAARSNAEKAMASANKKKEKSGDKK